MKAGSPPSWASREPTGFRHAFAQDLTLLAAYLAGGSLGDRPLRRPAISMTYSRLNPSPTFRELEKVYAGLHATGLPKAGIAADRLFDGQSLRGHIDGIRELVASTGARSILDFGSGKARHYKEPRIRLSRNREIPGLQTYWGVDEIACYDPGVEEYALYPDHSRDGVVCTDVLEHIPEDDIGWLLEELFGLADKFVYANIAGYPATKVLPNGWNAHVTVKPRIWWREKIIQAAKGWRGQHYRFTYEIKTSGIGKMLRKSVGLSRVKKHTICEL